MTLSQNLNDTRMRAVSRVETFGRTLDGIRADRMLSEAGQRHSIARAYVLARRDVDGLRAHESQLVDLRKRELERVLFGWEHTLDPAVLRARRESNELADQLDDPRDALAAYETAKTRSDDLHARAIFARALERGWAAIVSDYITEHPGRGNDADELAAIHELLSPMGQLSIGSIYYLVRPRELGMVDLGVYERELSQGSTRASRSNSTSTSDALTPEERAAREAFARQLRTV